MTNQDIEDNKAQSHTSSSTNMTSLSVLDMPFPMAKNAPKKFKGHYADIQPFIDHYEQLCTKYNVILDINKCKTITRYCSRKVIQVIEGLTSYTKPDWSKLKKDILRLYDAGLNEKRYTRANLKKFMLESREKKVKNWNQFTEYTRNFTTIGGWLRVHDKIIETEEATYY